MALMIGPPLGKIGGAEVNQQTFPSRTFSGSGVRIPISTFTVPAGETWLVALAMDLTDWVNQTYSSRMPYLYIDTTDVVMLGEDVTNPCMVITVGAGTHTVGVHARRNHSYFDITGTATLYTVEMG